MPFEARPLAASMLLHQEGVVALIALVGLAVRGHGEPLAGLAPRGPLVVSIALGCGAGTILAGAGWLVERCGFLTEMQHWLRQATGHWSRLDVAAVALFSGVAEEALMRALLQPMVGLLWAALIFGLLHVVPDRRLLAWPIIAFGMGVALGLLYERWGYPSAAAAHATVNGVALWRLTARCGDAAASP